MKTLKKLLILLTIVNLTTIVSAQIKVTSDGNMKIPGSKDVQFGNSQYGDWIIEHWDDGLHFGKPYGSTNAGAYKVFIRDDNGYVGIGLRPDGLFQICRSEASNYRGILMGNLGNEINGRYGYAQGRASAINGDLILNRHAGNVGIGTTSPAYRLDVNGDIATYGTLRISSDIRLKKNIVELENCFDKLVQLDGINFEFEREEILSDSTDGVPGKNKIITHKQNGFSAQQVQQVLPELVSENKEGYLAVDYISFIPMLVEALKEQNAKIESLETELSSLNVLELQPKTINTNETTNLNFDSEIQPFLGNNIPNPFDEVTEIEFYLPQEVSEANFYLYDMQGKQIQKIHVVEREYGSIVIQGSQLMPGMYYYSLIANNQVIGTKQMILTD